MTRANIPNLIHRVRGFESLPQIVCHIHNNTVMGDEHILSLQSNMEFLPVWLPRIVLQRGNKFLLWEKSWSVLCADKTIISFYS